MKVLLLNDGGSDAEVATELLNAGHSIVRCGPGGRSTFPCAGVRGECPLDGAVDVAVAVHRNPSDSIPTGEAGAVCAIRDGIPLVLAGTGARHPFGAQVGAVAAGTHDVPAACERAVAGRLARLGRAVGGHVEIRGRVVRVTVDDPLDPNTVTRVHRRIADAIPSAQIIDVLAAP